MAVTDGLSRYRYISTLGSGGMARVDLAQDTLLERQVALKRMSEPTDPRGISRLRREAMTGASLSHPNLVSIYDVVTGDDGRLVLVMEYVAGETLRARINRESKLPVDETLRILEGVAAGLDAIHSRGIVHRDVKPSNILLGDDSVVKVADLGIASVPDGTRITTSGSIIGSLSYMAPEQLADTRARPTIDIYALAAVAFEMLSGRKARREPNAVALAHALATQPPPDLRAAWAEAPVAAAEVLSRGMSRDPKARPQSAGELVAGLKAALTSAPTVAMPVPEPRGMPVAAARRSRPPAPPRRGTTSPPLTPSPPRGSGQRGLTRGQAPSRPRPVAPLSAPAASDRRRRARAGPVAALLLGLVAAAAVLAVVLNSGGEQQPQTASTEAAKHRSSAASGHTTTSSASGRSTTAPRSGSASTPSGSTGAASSGSSSPTTSTAGAAPSSSSSPATSTAGASAGTPGTTGSASTPVSAVESFYQLAAAHRYGEAWALADSSLRAQLRGYSSFQAGQAGTRSITFDSARTVSQSANSATVAVQTTAIRDDGTHRCSGTVDLVPGSSSGGWVLHQIHIGCTS